MLNVSSVGASQAPGIQSSYDILAHAALRRLGGLAFCAIPAGLAGHGLPAISTVCVNRRGLLINRSNFLDPGEVYYLRSLIPQLIPVQLLNVGEEPVLVRGLVNLQLGPLIPDGD